MVVVACVCVFCVVCMGVVGVMCCVFVVLCVAGRQCSCDIFCFLQESWFLLICSSRDTLVLTFFLLCVVVVV